MGHRVKFLNYFFYMFLFTAACFQSNGFCQTKNNPEDNSNEAKIYVDPNDLLISDEGLFLLEEGEFVLLTLIAMDDFGIYVKKAQTGPQIGPLKEPRCPNGHTIYHPREKGGCGGCSFWWCNFRCKCYSPWP